MWTDWLSPSMAYTYSSSASYHWVSEHGKIGVFHTQKKTWAKCIHATHTQNKGLEKWIQKRLMIYWHLFFCSLCKPCFLTHHDPNRCSWPLLEAIGLLGTQYSEKAYKGRCEIVKHLADSNTFWPTSKWWKFHLFLLTAYNCLLGGKRDLTNFSDWMWINSTDILTHVILIISKFLSFSSLPPSLPSLSLCLSKRNY